MRHYDQTADAYDRQYGEEQTAKFQVALRHLTLPPDAAVLDAGCGTGLLFPHVATKAALAIGIDISLNLLKQAKTRARKHTKISLVRADVDHIPFKPQVFTYVFAFTLLQNTPNPAATLRELERVTRPNATIVVTGLQKHYTQPAFTNLLAKARLEITALETDDRLKDYVAVCRKRL